MMKQLALGLCILCLSGCTSKANPGWVGFVINQDQKSSSGQVPGKSYSAAPANFTLTNSVLHLDAGDHDLHISLDIPVSSTQAVLGKTVPIQGGSLRLPDQVLELEQGNFTLQTLSGGVGRGNYNARVKNHNPPWEVVGCFEAPCQTP